MATQSSLWTPQGPSSNGLGLGLFLSREIVLAHGGSIDVRSAFGAGTVVTITLDVVADSAKPRVIAARKPM